MESEWIIGLLALFTIGGTLGLAIFHFGFQLKSPANREAAQRFAADLKSASTRVSEEGVGGRSLRQRLDEAPGINERLSSRWAEAGLADALVEAKWSDVRRVLKGKS